MEISRRDSCDVAIRVPKGIYMGTDGIAAKLLRCEIASEAPQRNMPLSTGAFLEDFINLQRFLVDLLLKVLVKKSC